jgi:hypothetical protein
MEEDEISDPILAARRAKFIELGIDPMIIE